MIKHHVSGYNLIQKVWSGYASHVYIAEKKGRKYAIKILDISDKRYELYSERFRREANTLASLDIDGIPKIVEFIKDSAENSCIVMKYIEGQNAREATRQSKVTKAVKITRDLAVILKELNGLDIVHRDVKPENVIIDPKGKTYLVDFGLTKKAYHDEGISNHNRIAGTQYFCSPEQYLRMEDIDGRADIYCLGCLLYHMLTRTYINDMEIAIVDGLAINPEYISALKKRLRDEYHTLVAMLETNRNMRPSHDEVISSMDRVTDFFIKYYMGKKSKFDSLGD